MPDLVTTLDSTISAHLRTARAAVSAAACLFHDMHELDEPAGGLHQGDWLDQIVELLLELDPHALICSHCSQPINVDSRDC